MMKHLYFSIFAVLLAASIPAFGQEAGWIGVQVMDQPQRGVLIQQVEPNSPAAMAGLKANDVVIEFNKQDVAGVRQFARLVRETPVGRTVEIKVRRDNHEQTLRVTTAQAPNLPGPFGRNMREFRDRILRDMPEFRMSVSQRGIRVDSLTPQLREYFGVKAGAGVLVASVESSSAAARAGLKAGDVITAVDGKSVSSPRDFVDQMRSTRATVTLKIIRDKQEREIKFEDVAQFRNGPDE